MLRKMDNNHYIWRRHKNIFFLFCRQVKIVGNEKNRWKCEDSNNHVYTSHVLLLGTIFISVKCCERGVEEDAVTQLISKRELLTGYLQFELNDFKQWCSLLGMINTKNRVDSFLRIIYLNTL